MTGRFFLILVLTGLLTARSQAQIGSPSLASGPEVMEILGLSIEGVDDEYMRSFVQQTSRLTIGQQVTIPHDPAFSDAIRAIYRLGTYENVQIAEERRVGQGVFLVIRVTRTPSLRDYTFSGIGKGDQKELRKLIPLYARGAMKPNAIARASQVIQEFYSEKGRPLAEVEIDRTDHEDGTATLEFKVDRGEKVKVGGVIVNGNELLSDARIRGFLKTKKPVWWKFWNRGIYKDSIYREDLDRLMVKMNEQGFFDARIERDSVYIQSEPGKKAKMMVRLDIHEGAQYVVRDISWEGNTLFSSAQLSSLLGIEKGEIFNATKLQENLRGNAKSSDVSSLYLNTGHMTFRVEPSITVVEGDSLDIHMDVFEGDVYTYGEIKITGNRKTKEHVIRRTLQTVPGRTFSKDQIQESIRQLIQLNYFTQESLAPGPGIKLNPEKKEVDLSYNLEEQGSDQLELSGTWGRFGIILQLRFGFNNFSLQNFFKKGAWKPLPSGDGQQLSLSIQTNGRRYQQYSVSFTEPWFRGRPTPLGGSISYSRISLASFSRVSTGNLMTFAGRLSYGQQLQWPDPYFSTSTQVGYQYFQNNNYISTLPLGGSSEISVKQSLTRNSTDNPLFPMQGSKFMLSVEIAPPIGNLIQFHKWRLNTSWNLPLARTIAIGIGIEAGYIGSLTGEEVQFERFIVGGSPFETQGFFNYFGKDIVYMRAYPLGALGPRRNNDPFGGRILNKFTSEMRWVVLQSEQLRAAPYLFIDGANAWEGFQSYNPTDLYRSAGFGVRLFLPILGMIELTYGYNFDPFVPINSKHDGSKKWTFQFSLGQGFGQ